MNTTSLQRAFTLIELLIVVAIIAILAAISIPNFLEAQIRAKVSRVKSDLRSAATALEAYHVDWSSYPPPDLCIDRLSCDPEGRAYMLRKPDEGFLPHYITTPIAYLTMLPTDVFPGQDDPDACHPEFHPPHYSSERFNSRWFFDAEEVIHVARTAAALRLGVIPVYDDMDNSRHWLSFSHGPDCSHERFFCKPGYPIPYDPTNGTVSKGDIYYFGPGAGFFN
jgi:prepilin-type N-terminal cleavage/methylation domain-containing protein